MMSIVLAFVIIAVQVVLVLAFTTEPMRLRVLSNVVFALFFFLILFIIKFIPTHPIPRLANSAGQQHRCHRNHPRHRSAWLAQGDWQAAKLLHGAQT